MQKTTEQRLEENKELWQNSSPNLLIEHITSLQEAGIKGKEDYDKLNKVETGAGYSLLSERQDLRQGISVMAHATSLRDINHAIETKNTAYGTPKQKESVVQHFRDELSGRDDSNIKDMIAQFRQAQELLEKELRIREANRQTNKDNSF